MALNIKFHIENDDIPVVLEAFQAADETQLKQKMAAYLIERVTHGKRESAWKSVAKGSEIVLG